jgi:hypothetical protein
LRSGKARFSLSFAGASFFEAKRILPDKLKPATAQFKSGHWGSNPASTVKPQQDDSRAEPKLLFLRTTEEPGPDQYNGDHIIPRAQGGNASPDNTGTTCRTCNLQKGNRTPEQYYRDMFPDLFPGGEM